MQVAKIYISRRLRRDQGNEANLRHESIIVKRKERNETTEKKKSRFTTTGRPKATSYEVLARLSELTLGIPPC
jgi:hypothetical protein